MSNYTCFSSTLNGRASDVKYYAVKGRTGYFTFIVGLARLARPTRTAVEAGWDSKKKDRVCRSCRRRRRRRRDEGVYEDDKIPTADGQRLA